jgi:hypothetical protein
MANENADPTDMGGAGSHHKLASKECDETTLDPWKYIIVLDEDLLELNIPVTSSNKLGLLTVWLISQNGYIFGYTGF